MKSSHEQKKYSIFQIASNLTAACLISGGILAATYYVTAPVAAAKSVELTNQAMKSLVKNADSFNKIQGKDGWYKAEKNNKTIAYVVPASSKGYGGIIKMLVAITPEGKEIDYTITEHNETPGLGDNARKDSFRAEFKNKGPENMVVVKDPADHKDIQAMTGATITSRAVTKAIKEKEQEVLAIGGGK